MEAFIVETKQLVGLSKNELQKVWDMLKSTNGTSVYETIKELNPKHINAVSINDFPYLGVLNYSNDTVFTNYPSRLKGNIVNVQELVKKDKLKPFIVETSQLVDLSKEDLQKVWNILKITDGTYLGDTIHELCPEDKNAYKLTDFSYLGVAKHNDTTMFSNYKFRLKGKILDINKLLGIPESKQDSVTVPHVHAELIKKWAEGAQIQQKTLHRWEDCCPLWNADVEYRIKPYNEYTTTVTFINVPEYDMAEISNAFYKDLDCLVEYREDEIDLVFEGIQDINKILSVCSSKRILFKDAVITNKIN